LPFTPTTVQFDPDNLTIATGTVTFNSALARIDNNIATADEKQLFETLIYPNPSTNGFTVDKNLKIKPHR
jgi:hypothetical protein